MLTPPMVLVNQAVITLFYILYQPEWGLSTVGDGSENKNEIGRQIKLNYVNFMAVNSVIIVTIHIYFQLLSRPILPDHHFDDQNCSQATQIFFLPKLVKTGLVDRVLFNANWLWTFQQRNPLEKYWHFQYFNAEL